jgi:hypothetical protein
MNAKLFPLPLLLSLIGGASSALAAVPGYPEPTPCPDHAAWRQAAALPDWRSLDDQALTPPTLANPTAETQALYLRLKQNEVLRSALFGQQHASWQGVAGNRSAFGSDVFDGLKQQVADRPNLVPAHPAIFGWNYESYRSLLVNQPAEAARLLARMIETDARGGITTIHWPVENFVVCEGRDCDDNTNLDGVDPVDFIVNNYLAFDGQCAGDKFDHWVDDLATFLQKLKQGNTPIPVILRPFHEMNGKGGQASHWWVGKNTAQFRTMWQRLVDRLRTQHGLRNVLIAFAPRAEPALEMGYGVYWPEGSKSDQASLRYVDIAGFDFYLDHTGTDAGADSVETKKLGDAIDATRAFAKDNARSVKRLVAITEVGRKDGTSNPSNGEGFLNFWMKGVKPALDDRLPQQVPGGPVKSRWEGVAYMMTWTNGGTENFSIDPTATKPNALEVNRDFTDWFQLRETLFLKPPLSPAASR